MSLWLSRGLVFGLLAGLVGAAASGAGAQSGVGPCAPGTVTSATLGVEEVGKAISGPATATHPLGVSVTFGNDSVVDDQSIQFSAPPPATLKAHGPSSFRDFVDDTPGPVPITITWLQYISGSSNECSASTSATLQLQAPVPVQLSKPPKRDISRGAFVWVTRNIGPHADLRPIEVRVRSVRRARFPGPHVPFKIATVALRPEDPGFNKAFRTLRTPRFKVDINHEDGFEIDAEPKVGTAAKPLGYEILVLQQGRQLARIRVSGRCGDLFGVGCFKTTVKIER